MVIFLSIQRHDTVPKNYNRLFFIPCTKKISIVIKFAETFLCFFWKLFFCSHAGILLTKNVHNFCSQPFKLRCTFAGTIMKSFIYYETLLFAFCSTFWPVKNRRILSWLSKISEKKLFDWIAAVIDIVEEIHKHLMCMEFMCLNTLLIVCVNQIPHHRTEYSWWLCWRSKDLIHVYFAKISAIHKMLRHHVHQVIHFLIRGICYLSDS